MRKLTKHNLVNSMIKCLFFIFFLKLFGCEIVNNSREEMKILLNEGNRGWYFVFMRIDSIPLSNSDVVRNVDMCKKNFFELSVHTFNGYKFEVYDCASNSIITDKMRLSSISEGKEGIKCFLFYNPYKFQLDKDFVREVGQSNIIDSLNVIEHFEFHRIIEENNISWY